MEKTCANCGENKSTDGFNTNRHSKDGFQSWCKQCVSYSKRMKRWNSPIHALRQYEKQLKRNVKQRKNAKDKGLKKECLHCKESLPAVDEHWYTGNGKFGYKSSCKKCDNKQRAARRRGRAQ